MTTTDNTQQPLVSFIVTYYNLPVDMLCECIDSILKLNLTPAEREIIVVDDGSKESPMNGLMPYGDEIIYVRQKNAGVSSARNTAISMARGEYIQIVDGDDRLIPAPYEHCLDIIRQQRDIEMVVFDFTDSTTIETIYHDLPVMSGSEYMLKHNIRGTACCYLFKRTVLSKLRFTPGIHYGEDEEFTPQMLLRAKTVVVSDAKAYFYRDRSTSAVHQTSDTKHETRLDHTLSVICNLNRMADTLPYNDRLALRRRVAQLTMDYIYNTIVLTRSRQALDQRLDLLRAEGLFPLPDHNYSQKYTWFRKMTNTRLGRLLLLNTLPLLKRER
jgi:glycosyltransferase involved in cell wall biosynthesis